MPDDSDLQELLEDLEALADEFERQRAGDWRTDQAFERASNRLQELITEHRGGTDE